MGSLWEEGRGNFLVPLLWYNATNVCVPCLKNADLEETIILYHLPGKA